MQGYDPVPELDPEVRARIEAELPRFSERIQKGWEPERAVAAAARRLGLPYATVAGVLLAPLDDDDDDDEAPRTAPVVSLDARRGHPYRTEPAPPAPARVSSAWPMRSTALGLVAVLALVEAWLGARSLGTPTQDGLVGAGVVAGASLFVMLMGIAGAGGFSRGGAFTPPLRWFVGLGVLAAATPGAWLAARDATSTSLRRESEALQEALGRASATAPAARRLVSPESRAPLGDDAALHSGRPFLERITYPDDAPIARGSRGLIRARRGVLDAAHGALDDRHRPEHSRQVEWAATVERRTLRDVYRYDRVTVSVQRVDVLVVRLSDGALLGEAAIEALPPEYTSRSRREYPVPPEKVAEVVVRLIEHAPR